jgi:hypothetical protein
VIRFDSSVFALLMHTSHGEEELGLALVGSVTSMGGSK